MVIIIMIIAVIIVVVVIEEAVEANVYNMRGLFPERHCIM